MRVLIYSDVHGNLPAFEAMLKQAGTCDRYICLGDLVNYGPWSNECVDLAMSLPNSTMLMGNHEEAFIQGFYPGPNELVQQFFNVCYTGFAKFQYIKNFKASCTLGDFLCTHTILDQYIYPDTSITLDRNYIIGHSHHQFQYNNNGFVLFNAGSVGQNRKFINAANYLLYDEDANKITMQQVIFDINMVLGKMAAMQYPESCIQYYRSKETLPV